MIRGMGLRIQDAFQGNFRKKKPPKEDNKEVEKLESSVRITYLSRRQLEEASLAEKFLLENLDHGQDFKNLYYLKHQFLIVELEQPCFCDLCGLLIWGVYRLSLRCRNCNLSCHPQCKQFLRLLCPKPRTEKLPITEISPTESSTTNEEDQTPNKNHSPLSKKLSGGSPFSSKTAAEYNRLFPFAMLHKESDGSYTCFVRIVLRLKRPITVTQGPYPKARVTSFYLPRNSEKLVHIKSTDDTMEVVRAILSKFRIRDDARKFSLFLEDKDSATKLECDDLPLRLVVKSSMKCSDGCRLILQETDPRSVLWDAFTVPELENFKLILDREEEECAKLIRKNYELYKQQLMDALDQHNHKDLKDD